MIELTAHDVGEFRELYRRETGRDISEVQARAYAFNLVQLVGLMLKRDVLPGNAPPPAPKTAP